MSFLIQLNRILSRFGTEIIHKKNLDRLVYSASCNRKISSVQSESMPDPFDDQEYLVERSSPVIFDVGSYVGEIAEKYAKTFPEASIYAFEPTLNSFHELSRRSAQISNIEAFNFAFADTNKRSEFYLNKFSPTNSLLESSRNADKVWGEDLLDTEERVYVDCRTIDSFCHDKNIQHIDILKLDVQGGELSVLKGAANMLKDNRISLIYTEIIFADTYQNQTTLTALMEYMDCNFFHIFNFYNPKYLKRRLIQADLIFVNQGLFEKF